MCFKPLGCLSIPLAQGIAGTNGNSVLNGTGVPSSSLGVNGDFYIDTNNSQIYGPKTAGAWGGPTSLLGLTGNGVLSGAGAPLVGLGENGDFYIDTTANAIYGPKTLGSWGSPTSLVGTNGANGTTRLYELLATIPVATVSSWEQITFYSVPANTLVNNGDSLVVEIRMARTAAITGLPFSFQRRLLFGGQSTTDNSGFEPFFASFEQGEYVLNVEIIKSSANTVMTRVSAVSDLSLPAACYSNSLSGFGFTSPIILALSAFQPTLGTEFRSFTVDKISS
jgi:hypothetical protein